MTGAMLKAAELKMVIMVDGFIASTAFLAATHIDPDISDYAVFCHQSEEKGHKMMLEYMNAKPMINLNMRLGDFLHTHSLPKMGRAFARLFKQNITIFPSHWLDYRNRIFYFIISFSLNFPY